LRVYLNLRSCGGLITSARSDNGFSFDGHQQDLHCHCGKVEDVVFERWSMGRHGHSPEENAGIMDGAELTLWLMPVEGDASLESNSVE
jgi:hypothetical protein